jgi:hypothetical protein
MVVTALGVTQILAWGSSYYLLTVLAAPIGSETGWSAAWVIGALSLGLLVEGFLSPFVGDAIERYGGRLILAGSSVFMAAGLTGLAAAPSLPFYVASWLVIGVGMGAGLYDAAFSTLGRLYGLDARRLITLLTLFGGFASTVCWPLTAVLEGEVGWRGACLFYALVHLCISLPLHLFAIPREDRRARTGSLAGRRPHGTFALRSERSDVFLLLAVAFAVTSSIAAIVSVHLVTLLVERGSALAVAVGLGALMGPSQVAARLAELALGRRHHPIWAMAASSVLIGAGILLLWVDAPFVGAAIVIYGGGMGIRSIVRGTMPLAVFGAEGYASLMGRLAMPSLLAGAASPFFAAVMLERFGANGVLALLFILAMTNVLVVAALWSRVAQE